MRPTNSSSGSQLLHKSESNCMISWGIGNRFMRTLSPVSFYLDSCKPQIPPATASHYWHQMFPTTQLFPSPAASIITLTNAELRVKYIYLNRKKFSDYTHLKYLSALHIK